jgi:hypothetical protein
VGGGLTTIIIDEDEDFATFASAFGWIDGSLAEESEGSMMLTNSKIAGRLRDANLLFHPRPHIFRSFERDIIYANVNALVAFSIAHDSVSEVFPLVAEPIRRLRFRSLINTFSILIPFP